MNFKESFSVATYVYMDNFDKLIDGLKTRLI